MPSTNNGAAALWLVRHAQPLVAPGICYGATDLAADAAHTQVSAQQLAQQLPVGLPVWSSPLRRCAQLAQALGRLRPDLRMGVDARLREMDFGRWEGLPWAEIPSCAFDDWTANFGQQQFGGAESVQQLMDRVAAAWDARPRTGQTVWITHAGVIQVARLLARGVTRVLSSADWPRETLEFGQMLRL